MNFSVVQLLMALMMSLSVGMSSAFAVHLKKDGTPDMRYKENRESSSSSSSSYSVPSSSSSSEGRHLKRDGTPDMRYRENRGSTYTPPAPVEQRRDPVIYSRPSGPLKSDGTPDMRYKENRETYTPAPAPQRRDPVVIYNRSSGPLKQDGTPDMRYKENQQRYGSGAERPSTTTPRSQWQTGANGRYVDPRSGRPLNNDGTYDMRSARNKDLPYVSARVRIGVDNSAQAEVRQSRARSSSRVVINNYYTYINNTYISDSVVYGSWGYQNRYYRDIVWGAPVTYCTYSCGWYTPSYWDVWINTYNYYPSYYYTYRPVVISDADLAYGLVSWLFVSAIENSYQQGRYDQAILDDQQQEFYRESLQTQRPVRSFRYSQAFLPTEDFIELAKDISGADPRTVQNFMDGLENMTSLLQERIRLGMNNPNFTIQKNDIDVRLAENHGNVVVLLKGHIDRRSPDGATYIARADFTGSIDLRTSASRIFVVDSESQANPSSTDLAMLESINQLVQEVDAQLDRSNAAPAPAPAPKRWWQW